MPTKTPATLLQRLVVFGERLSNRSERRSELYRKLRNKAFLTHQALWIDQASLEDFFGDYTPQQLEDNRIVYEYLVSAGNETMILDSAEEYGAFLADPAGYVRSGYKK